MSRSTARSSYLRPLVALVLIVAILYVAKPVIVPLAFAVLLTFVLTPVVTAIQRRGVPRVPAVLLAVLLTFILFGLVGWVVGVQVNNLVQELPTHRKEIEAKIAGLRGSGEGAFGKLVEMFREIGKEKPQAGAAAQAETPKEKVVIARAQEASSFEQLASVAGPVLEPLAQAGLVLVLVVFMLIKREDLRNRLIGLLGHGQLTGTTRVLVDSAQRLSRFLLTQLLINVGFGVLFAAGLFILGVPYAFLWGFLAVVLRFVPYIGSWVALAFPLILAFAMAPTWTQPILVLSLFALLELITANVVEPLLFGHGTGVTPIALLVAAAFWTWIWGPLGLVLSTPLTVCLVVLGQHVPRLRYLALLLGDEPALQPHVSYYQRLLARDQDEAKQVAAEYAQAKEQENVYDDVFLPALALARRDRKHSGLSADDEGFIYGVTKETLDGLDSASPPAPAEPPADWPDGEPLATMQQPDQPPAAALILGCPAHHEAEELSLHMLARLLRADGYQMEAVSTKALPAEVEARIEREGPALLFIAILPPGGLLQARYLCKRLRKRFPDLPIVVGYWGDERHYDSILARLRSAGASYVTTSLLQSRSQIRALLSPPPDASPEHPPREDRPALGGTAKEAASAAGRARR
ncbi:MAG TPA: AI-2E family transporter [Gemmataceae bacterium]|nr:AI-2E family transporter [Gemmataceae bacterium]